MVRSTITKIRNSMINGVTELVITKIDVLTSIKKIKICTHYHYNGKKINYLPFNIDTEELKPFIKNLMDGMKMLIKLMNSTNFQIT